MLNSCCSNERGSILWILGPHRWHDHAATVKRVTILWISINQKTANTKIHRDEKTLLCAAGKSPELLYESRMLFDVWRWSLRR
jgi:hypothetical protein